MALAVCLLLDDDADRAVRSLWRRLEGQGVPTLQSHTHGRHLPHLTLAGLHERDAAAAVSALRSVPPAVPLPLHLDGLGTFRRSRCWLAPAVHEPLLRLQEAVVTSVRDGGLALHRHYRPGAWIPHLTIAPRLQLHQLPTVAAAVYSVLPIEARGVRTVVVDTSDGSVHPLSGPS